MTVVSKWGTCKLFDWEGGPPQRPDPSLSGHDADIARAHYDARRQLYNICQIVSGLPVMRGMLEKTPVLTQAKISFVEMSGNNQPFAQWSFADRELHLNATKILQYCKDPDHKADDFDLNCIFLMLHEFRHGFQQEFGRPHLRGRMASRALGFASLYGDLFHEADANAFGLTGLEELRRFPSYAGLVAVDLKRALVLSSVQHSFGIFQKMIDNDPDSAETGAAQQAVINSYFAKKSKGLLRKYAKGTADHLEKHELLPPGTKSLSFIFGETGMRDEFFKTFECLQGMPSLDRDGVLHPRDQYMSCLPLAIYDVVKNIEPETLTRLGLHLP